MRASGQSDSNKATTALSSLACSSAARRCNGKHNGRGNGNRNGCSHCLLVGGMQMFLRSVMQLRNLRLMHLQAFVHRLRRHRRVRQVRVMLLLVGYQLRPFQPRRKVHVRLMLNLLIYLLKPLAPV